MFYSKRNDWVVQKFGGRCIGNFPDEVADIIASSKTNGVKPAVVCSARSYSSKTLGTTDQLLQIYQTSKRLSALRHDRSMQSILFEKLQSIVRDICEDHLVALRSFVESFDIQFEAVRQIRRDCEELLDYLVVHRRFNLEIKGGCKDKIVSFGERLSCRLVTAMLQDRHIEAEYVDLSRILPGDGCSQFKPEYFDELATVLGERVTACNGKVPVITGFFGVVPGNLLDGKIGRGYSDLCAMSVAVGLKAKELQIWKDIDGIFTADPNNVPSARCLASIRASEAAELTFYGSQVIHHLALALAIREEPTLRISVQNVQKPRMPGTIVIADKFSPRQLDYQDFADSGKSSFSLDISTPYNIPTAITVKRDIVLFNVISNKNSLPHDFLAMVFAVLANCDISVDLISTSEAHIAMAINTAITSTAQIENARFKLSEECGVSVLLDMAMLSLVGAEMSNGVAGQMLSTLSKNEVYIGMFSQGASDLSISCVVPAKDATRALNLVHAELLLPESV